MAGLAGRRSGVEAVVRWRRGEAKAEERRDEQDRRPRTPTAAATVKRFECCVGLDWTGLGQGPMRAWLIWRSLALNGGKAEM